MTSLHDRLADLAETAPTGAPPPGLWERGRRYGRRRRVETAALTLVLLAAIGSLVGALLPAATYDVGPADAKASLRLPDRIEQPSPWMQGTDDVGPIGPLVAVFPSTRNSGLVPRSGTGLVGVSAAGDYAFLDLPDVSRAQALAAQGVALSADGGRIAYPLTGDTRSEPNTLDGDVVVGVGVYDTVTGEATRLDLPSDHGLYLEDLRWVGDAVRFSHGRYVSGDGAPDDGLATDIVDAIWKVDEEPSRAERLADEGDAWRMTSATADGGAVEVSGRRVRVLPVAADARPLDLRLDVRPEAEARLSPSGVRLAFIEDPDGPNQADGYAQPLRFAIVPDSGSGRVATVPVPGGEAHELRGWRDDQHVVVQDLRSPGLSSVDVNTGAREQLVDLSSMDEVIALILSDDALQAPTYAADSPQYVMPPWLQAGLLLLAVLLAALGAWLWRRRGRV